VFLLCSSQMPIMTGVEVAREVREMGNPVYIVGCTGNALREDQVCAPLLRFPPVILRWERLTNVCVFCGAF
jgi:CheY-like chemotaxis protein